MRSACVLVPPQFNALRDDIKTCAMTKGRYDRVYILDECRVPFPGHTAPKHGIRLYATVLLDLTTADDVFVLNHYDTFQPLLKLVQIAKDYELPMSYVDVNDFLDGLYFRSSVDTARREARTFLILGANRPQYEGLKAEIQNQFTDDEISDILWDGDDGINRSHILKDVNTVLCVLDDYGDLYVDSNFVPLMLSLLTADPRYVELSGSFDYLLDAIEHWGFL